MLDLMLKVLTSRNISTRYPFTSARSNCLIIMVYVKTSAMVQCSFFRKWRTLALAARYISLAHSDRRQYSGQERTLVCVPALVGTSKVALVYRKPYRRSEPPLLLRIALGTRAK